MIPPLRFQMLFQVDLCILLVAYWAQFIISNFNLNGKHSITDVVVSVCTHFSLPAFLCCIHISSLAGIFFLFCRRFFGLLWVNSVLLVSVAARRGRGPAPGGVLRRVGVSRSHSQAPPSGAASPVRPVAPVQPPCRPLHWPQEQDRYSHLIGCLPVTWHVLRLHVDRGNDVDWRFQYKKSRWSL